PVRVDAERDGRVLVSELATHVRDGHAIRQEQRREGVPHLVGTAAIEPGSVKDSIQGLADVGFIQRGARHRREHPIREGSPCLEPQGALLAPPEPQDCPKLTRQVDTAALVVLWRRQEAPREIPLYVDEALTPVDVTP